MIDSFSLELIGGNVLSAVGSTSSGSSSSSSSSIGCVCCVPCLYQVIGAAAARSVDCVQDSATAARRCEDAEADEHWADGDIGAHSVRRWERWAIGCATLAHSQKFAAYCFPHHKIFIVLKTDRFNLNVTSNADFFRPKIHPKPFGVLALRRLTLMELSGLSQTAWLGGIRPPKGKVGVKEKQGSAAENERIVWKVRLHCRSS